MAEKLIFLKNNCGIKKDLKKSVSEFLTEDQQIQLLKFSMKHQDSCLFDVTTEECPEIGKIMQVAIPIELCFDGHEISRGKNNQLGITHFLWGETQKFIQTDLYSFLNIEESMNR